MSELTKKATTPRKKDVAYYIKSAIGIAIMVFFGLIPAPAPITQTGMILLGQFIGLIFLWSTVDMVWPTFLAIALFGFIATDIYPGSFALASVYEAGMQSLGNWCVILVFGLLLICDVLSETGIIRRLALWFLTRKVAKRSPWGFIFMFLLASLVIGLFMDPTPSQLLMFALATEIFEVAGVEKEDRLAKVVSVGITVSVVVAFAATPICHSMPILFMGIYSAISGTSVNWVSYMAILLPVAIVIWVLMFLFFKYFTKTDVSKFKNLDFDKIEAMKAGPMTAKEKFIVTVCLILVAIWILPGFLSILAPNSAIYQVLDAMTMYTPLLFVIVLFAIVRFDGKPVLNIPQSCSRINWEVLLLLAGIMMIASAMGEDTTGIAAWVTGAIAPMVSGLTPLVLILLLCVISVVLTNIANNIPVGIVLVTVSVPICMEMGVNPFIAALAISYCANLAYVIPPAFVPVATCYAYPYGGGKYMFRWGLVAAVVSIVVCCVMIYPLGLLFG
jgi:sodium-dependent dicarboxylate transporter 2/3/5